jgi:hypothetical protein
MIFCYSNLSRLRQEDGVERALFPFPFSNSFSKELSLNTCHMLDPLHPLSYFTYAFTQRGYFS